MQSHGDAYECKICGMAGTLQALGMIPCDAVKQQKYAELEPGLMHNLEWCYAMHAHVIFVPFNYLHCLRRGFAGSRRIWKK